MEYKIFPPNRYDDWFIVSCLSNLVFISLFVVLVRKLTGSTIVAFFAGMIFGGDFLLSPLAADSQLLNLFGSEVFTTPCDLCLVLWKNQPDIWSDSAVIAGLIFALDRKWVWTILCAFVAVAYKENGWLIFPLTLLMLWGTDRLKSTPRSVYIALASTMAALALIRLNCGMTVFRGYDIGKNNIGSHHGAIYRYLLSCTLPYPGMFLQSASAAVFGTFVFLGVAASQLHRALRLGLAVMGIAIAVAMDAAIGRVDPMAALYLELDWDINLKSAMVAFLCLSFVYYGYRVTSHKRLLISLAGMILISTTLIVLSTQVQAHVLYLAYAFRSAAVTLMLTEICTKTFAFRLQATLFQWSQ
jgi:hypothetical protein